MGMGSLPFAATVYEYVGTLGSKDDPRRLEPARTVLVVGFVGSGEYVQAVVMEEGGKLQAIFLHRLVAKELS